ADERTGGGWLMEILAWIAGLVGVVVALALAAWLTMLATSFRVDPGTVVLLLKQGRATGRVLGPGRHFIQPWRKVLVQVYPARELALVVGGTASADERVDHIDAALRVHFGDKAFARISYTVRCRLDTSKVQLVHNQYGPEGIWPTLRDTARRCLVAEAAGASIDDAFGAGFTALEERFEEAVRVAFAEIGFDLEVFTLREVDLGQTGEVIQATLRADAELELENALARVRQARLDNDAALAEVVAGLEGDVLLRYRQLESWREMARRENVDQAIPAALAALLVAGSIQDGSGHDARGVDANAVATDDAP
ncbi:MAG TPA: SPFH domain-containing protein, partial [Ilumatobacteraceae bacterium]|nr:SPFH domain-containing protein [Ilumatobacteraceae bacterium]